jgi:hypothetical protein
LPAKDRHHDTVIRALIKDGWKITGEQVKLIVEDRYLWIDIEAAKTTSDLIVLVEVKEFDDVESPIETLASAIGKYFLYRAVLAETKIKTPLYMAVTQTAYQGILSEKIGVLAVSLADVAILVFDPEQEEIIQWIL